MLNVTQTKIIFYILQLRTKICNVYDELHNLRLNQDNTRCMPYLQLLSFRVNCCIFKDARSVSLYLYNRSQILQYVKYSKIIYIAKNQSLKLLPGPGIGHGTSCPQGGCVTTSPQSQLRISIVVKLFNCFDAMGRNVNKQNRMWATYFQQIHFFCNILTCMNNFIWQFLIFTGVGFTALIWLECKM